MELMILVIYASVCVGIFKLFKIPLTKWSVPTAILGGVVLLLSMLLFMNYNHPHTKLTTQYYVTTPVLADLRGRIIEVTPTRADQLIKKGEVLFKIDPEPFQAAVDMRKAELPAADQGLASLSADLSAAKSSLEEARVRLKQRGQEYERYRALSGTGAVTQSDVDIANREYLAAKANVEASTANVQKAQSSYGSAINGVHTSVAAKEAALRQAQFELDSTVVRAPTDGYITQNFLKEGMMTSTLPLRPLMTFVHQQDRMYVAAFRQNSLLRLKAGDEAELIFPAIPGKVFKAEVVGVLPTIGEHEVQPNGILYTQKFIDSSARTMVQLKLKEDVSAYHLPFGTTAEAAVYTEHAHHLAMMRKILLRMNSWKNYLYLDN